MCGGAADSSGAAKAAIGTHGKLCRRIGKSGAGQMTGMCNRIAIAGLVQDVSVAMHLAQRVGPDGCAVLIGQIGLSSWQLPKCQKTKLDDHFEHGFVVDWVGKCLGSCLEAANENGAGLQVTALADQFDKDAQKPGGGRRDVSALRNRTQYWG